MDLKRLAAGAPPLRVSELATLTGYSDRTIRKLVSAGVIPTVGLTDERRIPVDEARRVLVALRVLPST